MKKILITLRHPGPTQAIIGLVPLLKKRVEKVGLIVSDCALQELQNRYINILEDIEIYYCRKNKWILVKQENLRDDLRGDNLEFNSNIEMGYVKLVDSLVKFISVYKADIILRTTPMFKWGVDEAIIEASKVLGIEEKCRCYQECFDCGNDLYSFPNAIATVNEQAKSILESKGIPAVVVGWLNKNIFLSYRPYNIARKDTRIQLGIRDKEQAILYCTVASGNIDAELNHFISFIKSMNSIINKRLFIKFHPRNTDAEKQSYIKISNNEIKCVDTLPMDGILSFADFLISPSSAINFDLLEYQVLNNEKKLRTLSIYTRGRFTESIISSSATKCIELDLKEMMGSLIVSETDYSDLFDDCIEAKRIQLCADACKTFGVSINESKNSFLKYLGII